MLSFSSYYDIVVLLGSTVFCMEVVAIALMLSKDYAQSECPRHWNAKERFESAGSKLLIAAYFLYSPGTRTRA